MRSIVHFVHYELILAIIGHQVLLWPQSRFNITALKLPHIINIIITQRVKNIIFHEDHFSVITFKLIFSTGFPRDCNGGNMIQLIYIIFDFQCW